MASICANMTLATGAVVLAGGAVNLTRPKNEVKPITAMQTYFDIIFGRNEKKKATPNEATPPAAPDTSKKADAPKAAAAAKAAPKAEAKAAPKAEAKAAPKAEAKAAPKAEAKSEHKASTATKSSSKAQIGGDTGEPSPPTPFGLFDYRPSKLPGPPKPYDPTKAT